MIYDVAYAWRWNMSQGKPALTNTVVYPDPGTVELVAWKDCFNLERNLTTWRFPAGAPGGSVLWPEVTFACLDSIRAARVACWDQNRTPIDVSASDAMLDNTEVLVRVWSSGQSYWWDGGDWIVSSNWTSVADFEANITAWPNTRPSIGFELGLATTDEDQTPAAFGIQTCIRLDLGTPSSATGRGDSWEDDAVVRYLMRLLRGVRFSRAHEQTLADGEDTIDLSDLRGYEVSSVDAVYDITADTTRRTTVSGSYSALTGIYTLDTPVSGTTRLHLHMSCIPNVALVDDYDILQATVPLILVDSLSTRAMHGGNQPCYVKTADDTALRIPPPRRNRSVVSLRIDAPDPKDIAAIKQQLRKQFTTAGSDGVIGVSLNTGFAIRIRLHDNWNDAPRDGGVLSSSNGTLHMDFPSWYAGVAPEGQLLLHPDDPAGPGVEWQTGAESAAP